LALTASGANTLQTFPEPQRYSHPRFSLIFSSAMYKFVYYDITKLELLYYLNEINKEFFPIILVLDKIILID
jgi:hypothetical protein